MVHRAAPPRTQRIAVLATVVVLHAAFFTLLLIRATPEPTEIKPTTIAVVALAAERPAAAKPPPPSLPAKVADTFNPVIEFSIPDQVESDAPAGATGACSTLGVVLDGLLIDPLAVDALRRAPPDTRSIAEAVVMWNEGWSPAANEPVAPLWLVRANIERTLASVDGACLDEPVPGPRLLPIPDASGTGTMFVVLGSGVWTWRALINPPMVPALDGKPTPTVPAVQ